MMLSRKALVGAFILGGFILFGVGLFFIGNRQKAFSRNYEIYTEFAQLNGLETGATVQVSGMQAGEVRGIEIPKQPSGRYRLTLRVQQKFAPLVRTDSLATIQTQGVVGNELLEVDKGTDKAPEAAPGATIPSREPVDFNALMQEGTELLRTSRVAVQQLQSSTNRALESVNGLANQANGLIASVRGDVKHMTTSGVQIVDSANTVVAGLQRGQGVLGRLLNDKQAEAAMDDSLRNVKEGSANLNQASNHLNKMASEADSRDIVGHADQTVQNTRQITDRLNNAVESFTAKTQDGMDGATTDLRQTIKNADRGFSDLAEDAEALKHNFFLRGFFKKRGFYDLNEMTPAQYRKSKFLKPADTKRTWLAATSLFESNQNGAERLSQTGRQAIDSAMSGFVSDLPNRPLMVEGYAESGSASERFLAATHRAEAVRDYVEQRFGLDPKLIGVMPMSEPPPPETGQHQWDGVSLVLLRK